jgi:uncharacterized protein (TIGR03000 family)
MMKPSNLVLLAACLGVASAHAGPFNQGIGGAMYYGPYTGGHLYSYNTAYSYGFTFSPADSWRRDAYAYPGGVAPYRPYDRPILYRAYPIDPSGPMISVEGADGLPVLRKVPATTLGSGTPLLQPVPSASNMGTVKVQVPIGTTVWVNDRELPGGMERNFTTQPLSAGQEVMYSIRAKWSEAGKDVEQFRAVRVKAGQAATVDFNSR